MFTADEYRTAAKVLEHHSASEMSVEFYRKQAEGLDKRDQHAFELALTAISDTGEEPTDRGLRIFNWLIGSGWTPPSGLL